jgi:squalene-hopene/tetraprenyl-beta-curcumene cyclase
MSERSARLDATIAGLTARLVDRQHPSGYWHGHLASSALSTATAVVALEMSRRAGVSVRDELVTAGAAWLARTQNADGGWGDTERSRSNLSTTLLAWGALSLLGDQLESFGLGSALERASAYLHAEVGELTPIRIRDAIINRYGKDRTFSVPILTVLAMTGRLGEGRDAWRLVPQLPFELAACPHYWFQWLRLPVVSYALPALIAIGQVRHAHLPTRLAPLAALRNRLASSTRATLLAMQPRSGGYLEATPLTSFVVMSLVSASHAGHGVVSNGVAFLEASVRDDGSWPIDTNLATWTTTLAVNAFGAAGLPDGVGREQLLEWLLGQQHLVEHPFTHAAPGGWAWTDLSGGVPDADDTAGALVALHYLAHDDLRAREAARRGVEWLLGLQNRDGGIPTFCRGWGALPFDRSAPDLTAHAIQAWTVWQGAFDRRLQARVARAVARALAYVVATQRADGSWLPLWFGNEHAADEQNPVYGTSRVILALARLARSSPSADEARQRGLRWLISAQNTDGGWGGGTGTPSSIEETGVALQAVARCHKEQNLETCAQRAIEWLAMATDEGREVEAAPIGLYFARLWYFEDLYPVVLALAGLLDARAMPR